MPLSGGMCNIPCHHFSECSHSVHVPLSEHRVCLCVSWFVLWRHTPEPPGSGQPFIFGSSLLCHGDCGRHCRYAGKEHKQREIINCFSTFYFT